MNELKISVVSPIYNALGTLELLVKEIETHVKPIFKDYEIILVDDGCPFDSWNKLIEISSVNKKVKPVKLSKNFGQHYAISAGLALCSGDWVVVMDCDLQDKPSEIPKLFAKTNEGYDVVLARRFNRQDKFFKRVFSTLFYKVLSALMGKKLDGTVANFGIYSSKVINEIVNMRESIRFFPTMVQWVGFKQIAINVEHEKRHSGKSSYNFKKLLKLGLDIILANSEKPIKLVVFFGFGISTIAMIFLLVNVFKYLTGQISEPGFISLILSIWLLGGLIIMILGILGLYIGKTFEVVKQRPNFIIDKKINFD